MQEDREPEVWKPIPDYEGIYEISSWGRVKSLEKKWKARYGLELVQKEKILKPVFVSGYYRYSLYFEKKSRNKLVHVLTAKSFVDNPNNYDQVNHIDYDKSNNYYKNLEWTSVRENQSHKYLGIKTSSIYIGVSYNNSGKRKKRWLAQININGKNKTLGNFLFEEEARDAYLKALKEAGLTNKYADKVT